MVEKSDYKGHKAVKINDLIDKTCNLRVDNYCTIDGTLVHIIFKFLEHMNVCIIQYNNLAWK